MSEEVKNKSEYLVEVRDLKQYFPIKTGFMKTTPLKAVDGVSFSIKPGETLGLVGESGCGKSTVGRQLVGLETPTGGRLFYLKLYHGEPPMKEDRRPQEICAIWVDHTNRIISFRKEDGAL